MIGISQKSYFFLYDNNDYMGTSLAAEESGFKVSLGDVMGKTQSSAATTLGLLSRKWRNSVTNVRVKTTDRRATAHSQKAAVNDNRPLNVSAEGSMN